MIQPDIVVLLFLLTISNAFWLIFCYILIKSNKDLTDKLLARNLHEVDIHRLNEKVTEKIKATSKSVDSNITQEIENLRKEPEIINGDE